MDADRLQWVVAGIGLNVNSDPAALVRGLTPEQEEEWLGKPTPTSLREKMGHEIARAPLLAALLARLTRRWTEAGERRSSRRDCGGATSWPGGTWRCCPDRRGTSRWSRGRR